MLLDSVGNRRAGRGDGSRELNFTRRHRDLSASATVRLAETNSKINGKRMTMETACENGM